MLPSRASRLWFHAALCVFCLGAMRCVEFDCSSTDLRCRAELLILLTSPDPTFTADPKIVTGNTHTCALGSDGSVRCWGLAGSGQLGYGNTVSIGDDEVASAAGTVPLGGRVIDIAAGGAHTCAVLENGNVRCWGDGSAGQLGYGNTNIIGDDETPASAGNVAIGGSAVQVVGGLVHTCALLISGQVVCWGNPTNGQLGYANMNIIGDDESPTVAGTVTLTGSVMQIAAGGVHTCAVKTDGAVTCWGSAANGRLGYSNLTQIGDDETPASAGDVVVGGAVRQISAGDNHTCAVLSGGTTRCWGNGTFGRLGYANVTTIGDDENPSTAGDVSVGGTVIQVSAGTNHTCAVLSDGNASCWGSGGNGRRGYGDTVQVGDDETPASAGFAPVGGTVLQISAGDSHTCALLTGESVRCWGNGGSGRLGYGNTTQIGDNETPASVGDVPYR